MEKVKREIRAVGATQQPFTVDMHGYAVAYDTFVFWDCVKSEKLENLQSAIIARVNNLREGLVLPVLKTMTNLSEEDKKDAQMYGSLLIGERFRPHITITRLKNGSEAKQAALILGQTQLFWFFINWRTVQ